jgi:hypothetical protein
MTDIEAQETLKATRSIATVLWLIFAIIIVFPLAYAFVAGGLAAYDAHEGTAQRAQRADQAKLDSLPRYSTQAPCSFSRQIVRDGRWVCP